MAIEEIREIMDISNDVLDWAEENVPKKASELYGWLARVATGEIDIDVDTIESLSRKAVSLDGKFSDGLFGNPNLTSTLSWQAETAMNMIGTIAVNVADIVDFFDRCEGEDDEDYDVCIDEQLDVARFPAERLWKVLYGSGIGDSYGQSFVVYIEGLGGIEGLAGFIEQYEAQN
jgi:hypothetical protein